MQSFDNNFFLSEYSCLSVFAKLDLVDIISCSEVSKYWASITHNEILWLDLLRTDFYIESAHDLKEKLFVSTGKDLYKQTYLEWISEKDIAWNFNNSIEQLNYNSFRHSPEDHTICTAQTKKPAKSLWGNRTVYYFEINVKKCTEENSVVGIGIAHGPNFFETPQLPGWGNASYGFHSDDGKIFSGRGQGHLVYAQPWSNNSVIGCCIDFEKKVVFFTNDGNYLGVAFSNIDVSLDEEKIPIYYLVGTRSGEEYIVNVGINPEGKRQQFKFNLGHYVLNKDSYLNLKQEKPPVDYPTMCFNNCFDQIFRGLPV